MSVTLGHQARGLRNHDGNCDRRTVTQSAFDKWHFTDCQTHNPGVDIQGKAHILGSHQNQSVFKWISFSDFFLLYVLFSGVS